MDNKEWDGNKNVNGSLMDLRRNLVASSCGGTAPRIVFIAACIVWTWSRFIFSCLMEPADTTLGKED